MPYRTARTIGKRVVPTASSAPGSWQLGEVAAARRDNIWPASATSDPYFSSVSLLLPMDGANGSTTFTDESNNSLTVTANGNAQISTTQSKFGGASAAFDGTGDYLTVSSSSAGTFGLDDFTVECWVYRSTSSTGGIAQQSPTQAPAWYLYVDTTVVRFGRHGAAQYDGFPISALPTSGWHHLALSRASGTVYMFVDGVSQTVTAVNGGIGLYAFSSDKSIEVGRTADDEFHGYIDDLRITKGVARYTAAFTPPTAPHPTS